ncbi:MAG: hypothetical protein JXR96_02690 [Deltaproteobacteria bacterium]|nr:hypothetical protein [Deltaproteobacteria bacterium]
MRVSRWTSLACFFALCSAGLSPIGCDEADEPCGGSCLPGQVCDPSTDECIDLRPQTDPPDLGRYLSLAVESTGRLVMAAYADRYGDMVFGKEKDDGSFEYEYVDGVPFQIGGSLLGDPSPVLLGDDVGTFCSLALDVLDRPHMAYFDRTYGRLKYAYKTGEGWQVVTVPRAAESEHVVGRCASMALDSDGLPHIAFLDEDAPSIKLARKFSDGHWAVERVESCQPAGPEREGEVGRSIALVLDHRGGEWIAYRDPCQGSLKVAHRMTDEWSIMALDASGDVASWIAADLDAEGNMALAYFDRAAGCLKYAWNNHGTLGWIVVDDGGQRVESGALHTHPMGQHCSLRFGPDGLARIAYLDGWQLDLRLVTGLAGGGFGEPQVVSQDGAVGFFNAMVIIGDRLRLGTYRYGRGEDGRSSGEILYADLPLEGPGP